MLLGIHYMRGIAALIVVLFHFRGLLNNVYADANLGRNLLQSGASGVDIFFMISGFIIMVASASKEANRPGSFLTRRVFRVYPALIICWVVGCLTIYSNQPAVELLKSVVPLNKDYNMPAPTFGFNLMGPPWTLTYEILFYAVFCLAISISHKHRALLASAILVTSIVSLNLIFNGSVELSAAKTLDLPTTSQWAGILKMLSSTYLLEFVVGMMFASFYMNKSIVIPRAPALAYFWACLGLFVVMFAANYKPGFGPQGYGIRAIVLVSGVVVLEKANVEIFKSSILSFLGDISYSMYISHFLIIKILLKYNPPIWSDTLGFSRMLLATVITIFVATIIYNFVEKPFIRIGKNLHNKYFQRNMVTTRLQVT